MNIEILTIGNELLNGDLADTNTQRFGALLRELGLPVRRAHAVPDTMSVIVEVLQAAAARSDVVLISGGLGPTEDDLTFEAAALAAGVPLVEHAATIARLQERFRGRGYPLTPNNLRQARVPDGAAVFDNPIGTAPHVQLQLGRARLFFFPGVPVELERLVEDFLRPWLVANAPVRIYKSCTFKTFGRTESQVATFLDGLPRDPRMHVAYRAHFPEIQVSLHVEDPDPAAADALLTSAAGHVRRVLGDIIYSEARESLPSAVARLLLEREATLALAESCTGGLVAKMLTDLAGSSAFFLEGLVVYSNAAKVARLGVPEALIEAHGAVSEETARALAEGVRASARTTWGVAITGIAGPGGATAAKPVGTTHLAVAGPSGTVHLHRRFPFDRGRNRTVAAYTALDLLRRQLLEIPA